MRFDYHTKPTRGSVFLTLTGDRGTGSLKKRRVCGVARLSRPAENGGDRSPDPPDACEFDGRIAIMEPLYHTQSRIEACAPPTGECNYRDEPFCNVNVS